MDQEAEHTKYPADEQHGRGFQLVERNKDIGTGFDPLCLSGKACRRNAACKCDVRAEKGAECKKPDCEVCRSRCV